MRLRDIHGRPTRYRVGMLLAWTNGRATKRIPSDGSGAGRQGGELRDERERHGQDGLNIVRDDGARRSRERYEDDSGQSSEQTQRDDQLRNLA